MSKPEKKSHGKFREGVCVVRDGIGRTMPMEGATGRGCTEGSSPTLSQPGSHSATSAIGTCLSISAHLVESGETVKEGGS